MLLLLIFMWFGIQSEGKFKDPATLRVYYDFSHVRDLQKPDEVWKEDMVLLVGNQSTLYTSYSKLAERTYHKKAMKEYFKNFYNGMAPYKISFSKPWTTIEYIRLLDKNNFLVQEYMGRYYWYTEAIEDAKWTLKSTRKKIHGYNCKLAEGEYSGRKWKVWYTEEIPVNSGPWKLGGLPGLILEAEDAAGGVSILATAIQGVDVPDENMVLDTDYHVIRLHEFYRSKKVTKASLMRLREQAVKNPKLFVEIVDKEMPHGQGGIQDNGLSSRGSIKLPPPNALDLVNKSN